MAINVIMPKQGLQMTEGTIIEWKVKEGDTVKEEQPILEIETDKLSIDIVAPASGVLLKIVHHEGDVVPVTEMIGIIGEEGEDISSFLAEAGPPKAAAVESAAASLVNQPALPAEKASAGGGAPLSGQAKVYASPRAKWRAEEKGIDINSIAGSGPDGLIIERDIMNTPASAAAVTPLAKKVATIHDVDLQVVKGTGAGGRITKTDVIEALHTPKVESKEIGGQTGFLVPHSAMRKTIAKRMTDSLHIAAQANHKIEVDAGELVRMREMLKSKDIQVSYTDILIKITAVSLRKVPILNSTWMDEGTFIKENINIGMAAALDEGLIVPVIHNADLLTVEQIHTHSRELIEKVKAGTLDSSDIKDGTFTVTNLGMFDIDSFTAIINQPESGILAVGRIKETPVAVNKAVVIRPMMILSLTYDHRVVDGAPAAKFLQQMKQCIETPYLLL